MTEKEFEELRAGGMEVNYTLICPRKLWLYSHRIEMEKSSDRVALGALLHETAYPRLRRQELMLDSLIKVDFLESGRVLEVKYSRRMEEAARVQILYYLYYLKRKGLKGLVGELRFPRQRRRVEVRLTDEGEREVEDVLRRVARIKALPEPPKVEWTPICRPCAYAEFCWA